MGRALVLNATYEPLCVVSVRRAFVLTLKQKAEVIHHNGVVLRSERLEVLAPSVVRLTYYVKVPNRARASLSRRAIFVRDAFRCQYCGSSADNVDHVVPRSRGGAHTWENVVASCRPCNTRKENRLPHEVGLRLRSRPGPPRDSVWIVCAVGRVEPDWEPYLDPATRRAVARA